MTQYFVNSTTGVDEYTSGSKEKPFLTLDYAIDTLGNLLYENATINLAEGTYICDRQNGIYYGIAGKYLQIVGTGKNTKLILGSSFNNGGYDRGTREFNLKFAKLVLSMEYLPSGSYVLGTACTMHFDNVVISNPTWINVQGGLWYVYTPMYFYNCISEFETYMFGCYVDLVQAVGCYGTFKTTSNTNIANNTDCKLLNYRSELQIDEHYNITDTSVDLTKIGVHTGEYSWLNQNCLIKMNGKYYSILEEFWDSTNKTFREVGSKNFTKGFYLTRFTNEVIYGKDTFIPLDKFNNFSIDFEAMEVKKIILNGYKLSHKTVVMQAIDTRVVEDFRSIVISGKNSKCLLKFGKDEKYYTYNFDTKTAEIVGLDTILTSGIDISRVAEIDFNKLRAELNFTSISFAFYLSQDSMIENVVINYLEVGSFSVVDATQSGLKVAFKKLTIYPNFYTPLLKINVL